MGQLRRPVLLLLVADDSRTGTPTQVLYLARGLRDRYEIHCACPEGWLAAELRHERLPVYIFDRASAHRVLVLEFRRLMRCLKPDIVHCHGTRAGVLGGAASRGNVLVYTEHLWTQGFGLSNRNRQRAHLALLRALTRRADCTIAVSKAVREFVVGRRLAAPSKTVVIHGAIEPVEPVRPQEKPVVGTLGRLTWVKGVQTLLQALPRLICSVPDIVCRVGGDGPDRDSLRRLASELGVASRVEWLGEVDEPRGFFESLQLYVHPSFTEAFGMVPLEAMSAGLPVVAARAGALHELIDDGVCGLLFTASDDGDLARRVDFLLRDRAAREALGRQAAARARTFSVQRMADRHDALYGSLLAQRMRLRG
jgi:glycosyltransferase involved in cell wall biosynthesis